MSQPVFSLIKAEYWVKTNKPHVCRGVCGVWLYCSCLVSLSDDLMKVNSSRASKGTAL